MVKKKTPKKKPSKAVTNWEEQLAEQANNAAKMEENTGGGEFFNLSGGTLSFNDSPMPNNEMAVIILDHILENVYYPDKYDPDTPAAPQCFAFGREEDEMEPHTICTDSENNQSTEGCIECEHNEWGSADTGRGKACRNTRRLCLIAAGTFSKDGEFEMFDDEKYWARAPNAYLRLPVTSVKGYASWVKGIASGLKRPPHGVFFLTIFLFLKFY